MTDEERILTAVAIDTAYSAQVGKLFGVLCSATGPEFESGQAEDRFAAGLRRAMEARAAALDASNLDIGVDPE